MKIYIVRHGETEANKVGVLQGTIDTPLTPFGIELAELTGEGMKDIKFDVAFSSPLKRASDTAKIIISKNNNKNVKLIEDDRIKEVNMGIWEGQSVKELNPRLNRKDLENFMINPFLVDRFLDGESTREVCERTQDFLKELVTKDYDTVLIATHGFAMRAMLNFLYDDPSSFWQTGIPYNCAVNIIEYKDGHWSFIARDKIYYDKNKCIDRYKIEK